MARRGSGKGRHNILTDAMRRIFEVERRLNNIMRPVKITDVDAKKGQVRAYFEQTQDQKEVLTPFAWPQQGRSGNERTQRYPTPGEQYFMFSPSGEVGMHSWFMPGGPTTKDGEIIKSKAFKPSEGEKWFHQRDTVEVIQEEPTLNQLGMGGALPCEESEKATPTNTIYSTIRSPDATETVTVEKQDDKEQTNPHESCWKDKCKKGVQAQTNAKMQHIRTHENRETGETLVSNWTEKGGDELTQNMTHSTQRTREANLSKTLIKDGPGNILKPLIELAMGGGAQNQGGGGGQNSFEKAQTFADHMLKGMNPGGEYSRLAEALGKYTRMTRVGAASEVTTVTQHGSSHDTTQSGSSAKHSISQPGNGGMTRMTGKYLNNAMQSMTQHSGGGMKIGSGGSMGISSGGSMSLAAGGGLKLAGSSVKIGGPVKLSKSFLGFGGTMPSGGGSGAVNASGTEVESGEEPSLEEESPEFEGGVDPAPDDEFDLHERLDGIDKTHFLIDRTLGTNIGNMTANGGLAAAFDGIKIQVEASCAVRAAVTSGFVGKTFASPTKLSKMIIYGSSNVGFGSTSSGNTISFYAKTGAAPANEFDGTLLGSVTYNYDTQGPTPTVIRTTNPTVWAHGWAVISAPNSQTLRVAELRFYRPATPDEGLSFDADSRIGDLETQVGNVEGGVGGLTATVAANTAAIAALPVPESVRIGFGTVTNAATLAIVFTGATSYRAVKIRLHNFCPATDEVPLLLRVSNNGGSSYNSGGSDYAYINHCAWTDPVDGDGSEPQGGLTESSIIIGEASGGSGTAFGLDGEITIPMHTNASRQPVIYSYGSQNQEGDEPTVFHGAGRRLANQSTNAVQLRFSSGNIATGSWSVYGIN